MSEEHSDPSPPRLHLGTLGHEGHGKTSLTVAITQVLAKMGGATALTPEQFESPRERECGFDLAAARVEYATRHRHYAHVDGQHHADCVRSLIAGVERLEGAILVVSATSGPTPQTREHLRLAHQVGVPSLVVFLNKVDRVEDPDLRELVEREVRDLLDTYAFPGGAPPIVSGSALRALEGDTSDMGEGAILALLEAVDHHIPTPPHAWDKPFFMPVDAVFSPVGQGTVATGIVEHGRLEVGAEVELVGLRPTRKTVVTRIGMSHGRSPDSGRAGDLIGVTLHGLAREEVERGQVLARPGSITPHTRFEARLALRPKGEGTREASFSWNEPPRFGFHKADVTGTLVLVPGLERGEPGDSLRVEARLARPVALGPGTRFALRAGPRTVGWGVVIGVIE